MKTFEIKNLLGQVMPLLIKDKKGKWVSKNLLPRRTLILTEEEITSDVYKKQSKGKLLIKGR